MAGVLSSLGLIHPSFRCSLQSTARRRRGAGRREKGRLPEASLLPCRRSLPDNDPGDFHLPPAKDLVTAKPSQASPPLLTSSSSCPQPPPASLLRLHVSGSRAWGSVAGSSPPFTLWVTVTHKRTDPSSPVPGFLFASGSERVALKRAGRLFFILLINNVPVHCGERASSCIF